MAKLRIPKAAQIRGLRKAIANRKTPRQFIPSLKKRLAKLTACILFALVAPMARAQAPVSIVPTQQTLAPAGTACTGSAQTFAVQNRNQTQHWAYIVPNGATNLIMQIQGVDFSGNLFVISDTSAGGFATAGPNPALTGSGYFPTVQVMVTCSPNTATFLLSYSGAQATPYVTVGSYLSTQLDKTIGSVAPSGSGYSTGFFTPPFGNSYGMLQFEFVGAGPTGSSVSVTCQNANALNQLYSFNLATTASATQTFAVPPSVCPNLKVLFVSGGASASTYNFDYIFLPPGTSQTNSYTHITSTTATVVKAGPGVVHTVVVGTPAAGTISLFDLASGSCTGTPATNVVSVITATSTFPAAPEIYDVLFNNGICVKASATMDITVSSQ
jgi:hypothetical protein